MMSYNFHAFICICRIDASPPAACLQSCPCSDPCIPRIPPHPPEKKSHGNAPSCHERTLTGLLALLHRESPVERLETAFTRR